MSGGFPAIKVRKNMRRYIDFMLVQIATDGPPAMLAYRGPKLRAATRVLPEETVTVDLVAWGDTFGPRAYPGEPMTPCPPHLAVYPWYAPHQGWLREQDGARLAGATGIRSAGPIGAEYIVIPWRHTF